MTRREREWLALCSQSGLTPLQVEHRGKHIAIVCREGRVFCPCTPSDWRSCKNVRSVARRLARAA